MNWGSWGEFFAMGGHGFYVWGAYGVTALFMIGEVVLLALRRRTLTRRLGRMIRMCGEVEHETQT
ncbi:MAG TPA: heme exporter protein CcmD [Gammaproteobacteria bacterium]|nr:heme exporter protein CcmD [Gammaproteobacteria bacterium]